jgi:hypothetical protein
LEQAPDGFPSWATPVDAAVLVTSVVDWLTGWDDEIAQLTQASIYWDEVDEVLHALRRRWLPEQQVQVFASRDCPSCGKNRTVIVNLDDESDAVTCSCTYCGWVVPHSFTQKYLEPKGARAA